MSATKPFWFAFNVTDWLSSKSVRMMSLAERGAYIGLLATAWGEEVPGTLPVTEDTVRRLAEMSPAEWAISGPALLAEFPVSDCGLYRYNPRLREEHAKQQAISEQNAEKGRRSAAKRAATKGLPTGNSGSTAVGKKATAVEKSATETQLITTTITSTSDDVRSGQAAGAKASPKERELPADESPAFGIVPFGALLDRMGYGQVNKGRYLLDVQRRAEGLPPRTVRGWENFILEFLRRDERAGQLFVAEATVAAGLGIGRQQAATGVTYNLTALATAQAKPAV